MAMGNPHVDYFSLDIEGAEFPVLQTIPWDKIKMTLLDVETNHAGVLYPGTRNDIQNFISNHNYSLLCCHRVLHLYCTACFELVVL